MIITDVFRCSMDDRCTEGSNTPLCVKVCPTGAVVVIEGKSYSCLTCGTCAKGCPNKAIKKNRFGGHYVDRRRCNGCGTCEILCPIGIIRVEREERVINNRKKVVAYPRGICVMCGLCVEACPHGARRFFYTRDLKDRKNRALLDRYIQILERIGKRERIPVEEKEEVKPKRTPDFRTSIYIDRDLCKGCGRCIYLCPRETILGESVEGCTRCNICGDVCPKDAISEGEVEGERCVLCGNCIERCPRGVLRIENFKVVKVKGDERVTPRRYCISCGLCADNCPGGALRIRDGSILYDPGICNLCESCVKVCPQEVRRRRGNKITGACALCGLCIGECPEDAISVKKVEKFQVIRDERCITCGTCAEVCPVDAITVKVKLGKRGEVLFNENCVMCEKCAIHCPRDVIPNTTGYKKVVDRENSYIWTDFDLCIKCGLCNRICPVDAIDMGKVDIERCEYCSACANICPTNAINIYRTWVEKV